MRDDRRVDDHQPHRRHRMSAPRLRGVEYASTSLRITGPITVERYTQLLAGLGAMASGHQWWIGDALVEGERLLGDADVAQAAGALGLEPHTCVNYRWVASKVAASRRREDLRWSHHAEVARLDDDDQARLLAEAVERGWGVRELREAVAVRNPEPRTTRDRDTQPERELSDAEQASLNRRLEGITVALENAAAAGDRWHEHLDLDDVFWLHRACVQLLRGGRA